MIHLSTDFTAICLLTMLGIIKPFPLLLEKIQDIYLTIHITCGCGDVGLNPSYAERFFREHENTFIISIIQP